MFTNNTA